MKEMWKEVWTVGLLQFQRYLRFFIFCINSRWLPKVVKIENFHVSTEYSSTTLWVQNSLKIALSLTVSEIFAIFNFLQKFKMAAKSCKN